MLAFVWDLQSIRRARSLSSRVDFELSCVTGPRPGDDGSNAQPNCSRAGHGDGGKRLARPWSGWFVQLAHCVVRFPTRRRKYRLWVRQLHKNPRSMDQLKWASQKSFDARRVAGWCRERKKFDDWPHLLALVIAGDLEQPKRAASKANSRRVPQACRVNFMGVCL